MAGEVKVVPLLSPEEWIKRQLDNLKAVGETNYGVGVAHPRRDPIAAGIAAEEKWAAQIKKAIEQERRKKALQATNIDEWYTYTTSIGKGRLVEGVTKREAEVREFVTAWQPMLVEHVEKIRKMPDVSDKDREERMLANLRGLKALKGKWRGK